MLNNSERDCQVSTSDYFFCPDIQNAKILHYVKENPKIVTFKKQQPAHYDTFTWKITETISWLSKELAFNVFRIDLSLQC